MNENNNNHDKYKPLAQAWRAFSLLSGIGIYLAVLVLICLYIGSLADEYIGLGGKGRLIGIIIGFPIAFYSLYRQLKRGNVI